MFHVSRDITLKDARRVRIRTITLADVPARQAFLRAIANEHVYTLLTPKEMDDVCERMPRRVADALGSDDGLYLIAEPLDRTAATTGEVIADFTIRADDYERVRHCARLGVEVAPAYRGAGLGDALMHIAMDWALAHPRIFRVELWVYADNQPAIALYRKHGFKVEGTRRMAMQWKPGDFRDDHLMARLLK
jgi:RimJ/RimL family protein N-acetyltransferase